MKDLKSRLTHRGKIVMTALAAILILVHLAAAVPPLPCEYYGPVTIDGSLAPPGTVITATINGMPRGSVATTTAGVLGGLSVFDNRLVVSATERDIDALSRPIVNFTVNGVCTNGLTSSAFYSGETRYIALASRGLLAVPGMALKPTDPDQDGIFEDLNGNGRLDFADVVLYFNQMTWISAYEPVCAFDLNGNGRIDFADIVALFNEI